MWMIIAAVAAVILITILIVMIINKSPKEVNILTGSWELSELDIMEDLPISDVGVAIFQTEELKSQYPELYCDTKWANNIEYIPKNKIIPYPSWVHYSGQKDTKNRYMRLINVSKHRKFYVATPIEVSSLTGRYVVKSIVICIFVTHEIENLTILPMERDDNTYADEKYQYPWKDKIKNAQFLYVPQDVNVLIFVSRNTSEITSSVNGLEFGGGAINGVSVTKVFYRGVPGVEVINKEKYAMVTVTL